jgi:hypothetical protein
LLNFGEWVFDFTTFLTNKSKNMNQEHITGGGDLDDEDLAGEYNNDRIPVSPFNPDTLDFFDSARNLWARVKQLQDLETPEQKAARLDMIAKRQAQYHADCKYRTEIAQRTARKKKAKKKS